MTEQKDMTGDALSPVKRALVEIRELRARLAQAEQRQAALHEPIAIVGMAMRFPGGVRDARGFETLLWSGTDAISEIPPERWSLDALYDADPEAPGKMITRHGAFIDGADRFDAEFFGIAPREAAAMDPQQRLMLEIAWTALENAGHAGADLAGSRTGIYVGVANNDYGRALYAHPREIDPYFATGNAYSVVAGRLSYFLGVHGPAIAIDTACSSSLVALHLAAQGLRLGECDLALAGGVNLILTPEMNINFSKANMMAPDGRCKTFDARADGYVRGEGCAMLVLRRLSEARAAGDRVLAVVRGSAINQDGRSGGLTAPNGPAQEAVIHAALSAAGVPGNAIGYVETHGTGTPLGDPIEVRALGAVLCVDRDVHRPLAIGSVKTNVGHLEAAAGVAGVIKVVLALNRGQIPPHLHLQQGSPHIDWTLPIRVPTTTTPWEAIDGRRLAGVSSFGFSGTNAHVILEQAADAPDGAPSRANLRPAHLLALSARDPVALAELARRYADCMSEELSLSDLCFTAHVGRTHFAHRLAVIGATRESLRESLAGFTRGETSEALMTGHVVRAARPQVAFLFTGQGAQHAGMGRGLYQTAPAFRAMLDRCAEGLAAHLDRGLIDLLFAPEQSSPINETRYAQPVNFALQVSLAALWRAWGIDPVAVMGHSLGEYAAACVAGVLPLEDGLRLVAERGRFTHEYALEGGMAAVFADESVAQATLAQSHGQLAIAAYNGPAHFVISGPRGAVDAAVARLEADGIRTKAIRVPHAAHSQQIEPVLAPFRRAVATVRFAPERIALVSNVTGAPAGVVEIGHDDYWLRHMREPVRFAQSIRTLLAQGVTHFIEIGPHPVLLGMAAECAGSAQCAWLPSLRRDRADWSDLLESLQRLYVDGADVDWSGVEASPDRKRIALPTYPFRERRHWMEIVGRRAEAPIDATQRWQRLHEALERQSEQGPLDLNASSYPQKWDCLARLTEAHALRTLQQAGLFSRAGDVHGLDAVLSQAGIHSRYRHLIHRWLERLVARGCLQRYEDAYCSKAPLPEPALAALWEEAETLFADNRALLDYVRNCANLVEPVLRGRESPLETLFPGGSDELAIGLYERSSTMRYVNALAATAVSVLGTNVPLGNVLRVLEVGGGTGGTTSSLLPQLPAERTSYVFSDVSDLFLDRARERFARYPFVDYRRFDMELPPAAQGFQAATFDLVVAANAVHACTDLRATLGRLRELLAPGGMLLLVESTAHMAWFDMTTGLIEGWQHFKDDLRRDNPLLSAQAWCSAAREAGFEASEAWPSASSAASVLGQHVLLARVAGEPFGESGSIDTAALSVPTTTTVSVSEAGSPTTQREALRARIEDALPAERIDLLRDFVRDRVMRILKLPTDAPPGRHDRLMDIGFDSLMAVQLRNQLATGLALGRALPATLMFDHPTIDAIAAYLLDRVAPAVELLAGVAPTPAASAIPAVLGAAAVAAMSDQEIEALLMERLGKP
jgi:acyl transferase domain-containing protein